MDLRVDHREATAHDHLRLVVAHLGFGRVFVSEEELPIVFVHLV